MIKDIIIDKLKIYTHISNFRDLESLDDKIQTLEGSFLTYFDKNAFDIRRNASYVSITFNPARFNNKNLNIQMISETELANLLSLLNLLDPISLTHFKIGEIHLTKNFVTSDNFKPYQKVLMNIKPRKRFKPILFEGKKGDSIYFHRLKYDSKNNKNEYTDTKIVKVYDKKAQMESKNIDTSKLELREVLSKEEQELFGESYNQLDNTLNLTNENLLRIEISYRKTELINLKNNLYPNSIYKGALPLEPFINDLKNNNLYQKLDAIFTTELKEILFYHSPNNTEGYNSFQKALTCIDTNGLDLNYIENVLNKAGYSCKSIKSVLEKINEAIVNDKYYQELYNLIFTSPTNYPVENFEYEVSGMASSSNNYTHTDAADDDIAPEDTDFIFEDCPDENGITLQDLE